MVAITVKLTNNEGYTTELFYGDDSVLGLFDKIHYSGKELIEINHAATLKAYNFIEKAEGKRSANFDIIFMNVNSLKIRDDREYEIFAIEKPAKNIQYNLKWTITPPTKSAKRRMAQSI